MFRRDLNKIRNRKTGMISIQQESDHIGVAINTDKIRSVSLHKTWCPIGGYGSILGLETEVISQDEASVFFLYQIFPSPSKYLL